MDTEINEVAATSMLCAMVLVATADQEGEDQEIEAISDIYLAVTGDELDPEALDDEVSAARDDAEGLWGFLKAQGPTLHDDEKRAVARAAVMICMADAELQNEEYGVLTRLARAINFSSRDLRDVMSEVWKEERAKRSSA